MSQDSDSGEAGRNESNSGNRSQIGRRDYLKLGGASIGASIAVDHGISRAAASSHKTVRVDEEDAIDETADLAAELNRYVSNLGTVNHKFVVPSGTYTWNTRLEVPDGQFFGLVGDDPNRVTFEVRELIGYPHGKFAKRHAMHLGFNGSLQELLLRNIAVDIDGTAPNGYDIDVGLLYAQPDGGLIENVHLVGKRHRHPDYPYPEEHTLDDQPIGSRHTFVIELDDPDGEMVVRDCEMRDGEIEEDRDEHQMYAIGFAAGAQHEGTIVWRNCTVEDFIDNGFYISTSPDGANELHNCTAINNQGTNIRLGRNDAAYDCEVILDDMVGREHSGVAIWGHDTVDKEDGIVSDISDPAPYFENITVDAPASNSYITNTIGSKGYPTNGLHVNGLTVDRGADSNSTSQFAKFGDNSDIKKYQDIIIEAFDVTDSLRGSGGKTIEIDRPNVTLRNGTYRSINSSRDLIHTTSADTELDDVRLEAENGEDALTVDAGNFTMRRTEIVADGPTAGLRAGNDFDRASMTVEGNSFENVELRDETTYDDLTLSDFEGEPVKDNGVIDNFESGTLEPYSYGDEASLSDAAALNSQYGLDLNGTDNTSGTVRSDSGLGTYPGPNDIWEFWWNPQTANQNFNVNFALQSGDLTEGFRVNVNLDDSNQLISFQERGSSGDTYIGQTELEIETGTWYRTIVDGSRSDGWSVHVDTGSGSSVVGKFTTDATQYTHYERSGIAYWISGADRVYLDDIAVRNENPLRDEEPPGTVVDDFESGDLNDYSVPGTDGAAASDDARFRGSYGLELNGATGGSGTVRSDTGLNAYPGQNDRWEFWWNPQTESEFFRVTFAIQSDDRSEAFNLITSLERSNQFIQLEERGATGDNYLGHADLDLSTDTWYRTVVDGTDGDQWTVSVDTGEGTPTVGEFTSDPTQYTWYDRSGIAYWISGSDRVFFDDVTIRTMGEPSDETQDLVVDDFDDADLEEWSIPSQSGTVETVTGSYDGSAALRCYDDDHTRAFANGEGSPSLEYVPQPGDKWEFYIKIDNAHLARFYFGRQGPEDDAGQYEIQLNRDNDGKDGFRIKIDDGNSSTTVGTGTYGDVYETGTWYRVRHWWDRSEKESSHVCELYDVSAESVVATVSGSDETWESGGIGVWANGNTGVTVDQIRILERDP